MTKTGYMCGSRLGRAVVALAWLVTAGSTSGEAPAWLARGKHGMVASDSAEASRIGRDILRSGGNAVDAAVAVSFALAVARPYSTGPGGGAFTIVRFRNGRVFTQDCRERASRAATADMYSASPPRHGDPPASNYGHRAVAVPGLVAGRCRLLERAGSMPLAEVIEPAVTLAEKGAVVDEHFKKAIDGTARRYEQYPRLRKTCPYVYRTMLREGRLPKVGDIIRRPALARLLRAIADGGPEFFYKGPVAKAVDAHMRSHGGLVTKVDLAEYLKVGVVERAPLIGRYRDRTIITMPPPSSGGIALLETLNILSNFDLPGLHREDEAAAMHLQIEAMKHAFADRARWLGDADFVSVPTQRLTAESHAKKLARRIDREATHPVDQYGITQIPGDAGTSHFCVVDEAGTIVVSTETINTHFGSFAAIDEWGLILNDEMDDFAAEPGKPNAYGLIQSERNAIEPGKRPLSSMTPTIVLNERGEPMAMLGASGGPRIISSVLNVLLGLTDYGDAPAEAMLRLRPHHQWRPDEVLFDKKAPGSLTAALDRRGHELPGRVTTGIVQAVVKVGDEWVGMSDPRKGGRPAGY